MALKKERQAAARIIRHNVGGTLPQAMQALKVIGRSTFSKDSILPPIYTLYSKAGSRYYSSALEQWEMSRDRFFLDGPKGRIEFSGHEGWSAGLTYYYFKTLEGESLNPEGW